MPIQSWNDLPSVVLSNREPLPIVRRGPACVVIFHLRKSVRDHVEVAPRPRLTKKARRRRCEPGLYRMADLVAAPVPGWLVTLEAVRVPLLLSLLPLPDCRLAFVTGRAAGDREDVADASTHASYRSIVTLEEGSLGLRQCPGPRAIPACRRMTLARPKTYPRYHGIVPSPFASRSSRFFSTAGSVWTSSQVASFGR